MLGLNISCMEAMQTDLNPSLPMPNLCWQKNLKTFLNVAVRLNLSSWCDITYFAKPPAGFGAISFPQDCITLLDFMAPSKDIFILCANPTHYFKVNYKINHLVIIDNTIYQFMCTYILVYTTNLSYIVILYISKLWKMLQ